MKRFLQTAAFLAAAMTALVACDERTDERATWLSETLALEWRLGDNEALAAFQARYDSTADSLSMPWSRSAMAKRFVENIERQGNDTLTAAARAIALSVNDFASHYASQLIDSLRHSATITPEQALERMTVIGTGAGRVGALASAEAYSLELDRRTRDLPVDEQMRVYARAAITPDELGKALAEEYLMPQADTALTRARLDALRHIYDASSMAQCEASFNNNIKKDLAK